MRNTLLSVRDLFDYSRGFGYSIRGLLRVKVATLVTPFYLALGARSGTCAASCARSTG